jgi:hypothetical protein
MLVLGDSDLYFVKKDLFVISNVLKKEDIDYLFRYFNNNRDNLKDYYPNFLSLLSKKMDLILKDSRLLNNMERFLTAELLKIF